MSLPCEFQLMGNTVKIRLVKKLIAHDGDGLDGHWIPDNNLIEVNSSNCEDNQNATLWHEVTHAICDCIGEEEISKNERFVEAFGQALNQVMKTLRY